MKIIGKTDKEPYGKKGFIIEASADEIARLCGYYSDSYYDCPKEFKKPSVGDEIQVNAMYNQLYELGQRKKEVAQAQATLIAAAKFLDPVIPIMEAKETEAPVEAQS